MMDPDRKPGSRDANKRFGARTKHKVNKNGFPLAGQSRKAPLGTVTLVHTAEPTQQDPRTGMLPNVVYSLNKAKRWEMVEGQLEADPTVAVRHETMLARGRKDPPVRQIVADRNAKQAAQVNAEAQPPTYADVVKQTHRKPKARHHHEPGGEPEVHAPVPLAAVYEVRRDPTAAHRKAHAMHNWDGCVCGFCKSTYDGPDARSKQRRDMVEQTFL